MNKKIKILFIILAVIFISSIAIDPTTVQAAERELEIEYPNVPSAITPNTIKALLPDYLKYVITLGIILSGLIVFGSMLFAGFLYMTSAGNPAALKNSKDRMLSSFLGVIILLSSYLILNTINPNLIILQIGQLDPTKGVEFTGTGSNYITRTDVPNFDQTEVEIANHVNILSPDVEVIPCVNPCTETYTDCFSDSNCPGPAITTSGSFAGQAAKIIWKTPGVYLYDEPNYKGDLRIYTSNTGSLGDFNNKAQSIKFSPSSSPNEKFGAILHYGEGFEGQCRLIIDVDELTNLGTSNDKARSITVFKYKNSISTTGGGVYFYDWPNYTSAEAIQFFSESTNNSWLPISGILNPFKQSIYSIKIDGNYLAALSENANGGGKCEVFFNSDSDLMDNKISQCTVLGDCSPGCPGLLGFCPVCTGSCASYYLVIPIIK